MASDDEKSEALETFLKDSLHALESLEKVQELEDEDQDGSSPQEGTASEQRTDADGDEEPNLLDRLAGYTGSAYKIARRTTGTSLKVGRKLMGSQDQLRMMLAAGESLRDLREVAGLTVSDLAESLNLRDKSLLEAAEDGTAALPFELILRLAAVLARNDPVPFILRYTRAYSPDTWRVLNDWGVGRLPLHFEREREFINIYRGRDEARELSDEGFKRVLEFTRQSFEMSLHFVAEEEERLNEALDDLEAERDAARQEGREPATPKRERRHRGQSQKQTEDSATSRTAGNQSGKSKQKQSSNSSRTTSGQSRKKTGGSGRQSGE
ncbi:MULTISPECIES: helix-turn-helix transcriptional regulator [Gammaproteobacteria]|jgi:transcriptional regulator with XRE-family HTH domain|uniref:XRE family transcriptional regulator n=1 Tax=Vreelandella halophila TaxID=86177 RepID=A0A9X4YBP1_9GAMM|nr:MULTISPECIES: helix-turn-helix transcriptional regulator [Gammaproteobacteria]KAA8976945.1 helix-turn-helix transcriptional regulator [Halospina sp. K52047b]MYL26280.1 XRE family transcriptional regulator [Halomonas utahensis]MYL73617.1 XRE family transcriptional regulator [Halomonas sp. 22501_18_FS]